eukprot:TRINITY_DN6480_c3_g1_i1.p1 TRINITY_DN6480_c3_g1~~TRINITY_DN6480_c3_g1_i1.p1  ORF type:complete len:374 (+),score=81.23 TRINITY_DN6480_c3_g1_i1:62-1123(+)
MARIAWPRIVHATIVLLIFYGTAGALYGTEVLPGDTLDIVLTSIIVGIVTLACIVVYLMSVPACCISEQHWGNLLPKGVEEGLVHNGASLDKFQVIGAHNSSHVANVFGLFFIKVWRYTLPPLKSQLDQGIRHFEIDAWYDRTNDEWFMLHENLIDQLTVDDAPASLHGSLERIYEWSKAHPDHFPLILNLDIKGSYTYGFAWAAPIFGRGLQTDSSYTPAAYQKVKDIVKSIWKPNKLFTPMDLKANATSGVSLRDYVRENGWPSVTDLKGKTLVFLNLYGELKGGAIHADEKLFFVRGHDFDNDKDYVYYENNYDRVQQHNCVSRSLSLDTPANFISPNYLTGVETSVYLM